MSRLSLIKGGSGLISQYGADTANITSILALTGNGWGTWGDWVEITPALPFDVTRIDLSTWPDSNSYGSAVFEIGVGIAGAESPLPSTKVYQCRDDAGAAGTWHTLYVPIKKGSRVAIRVSTNNDNTVPPMFAQVFLANELGAPTLMYEQVHTGTNDANTSSYKFTLTPDSVAGVKGGAVEITPSAPFNVREIIIQSAASSGNGDARKRHLLDIMTGAAGVETVYIGDIVSDYVGIWRLWWSQDAMRIPVSISRGTRIAARVAADAATIAATYPDLKIAVRLVGD